MQFLKKNYEKIVLAVVVIAALGVVAFLPIMVSQQKQRLDELENQVIPQNPKPLPPLDLSRDDVYLQRAKTPVRLDLANPHKIFNPYRWQMKADHTVFENPAGKEINQLAVTNISPLYEIYTFENASVSPGLPTHYGINIKHEAGTTAAARNGKLIYVALNQTTNNIAVIAAHGPEEDPTNVVLRLADTGQTVTLQKDEPFKRVEGYTADLVYKPDNKAFLNRRKTDPAPISFANEYYKIVDIEENEVVLLQLSNQKQWIRPYNPNSTNSAPAL